MVEKLRAYREELEAKKAEALAKDVTPLIDAEVAEFRARCEANAKAELDKLVTKIDSDIECIDRLIEREEAAAIVIENPEVTE